MIDANRDGFVDLDDLKDTYASLGMFSTYYNMMPNLL